MSERGEIKVLKPNGFGFILTGSVDVFFHASALEGVSFDSLSVGDKVQFVRDASEPRPRAATVRLLRN